MPNIKITVEGVKRMLQELKPQRASGPDKISFKGAEGIGRTPIQTTDQVLPAFH